MKEVKTLTALLLTFLWFAFGTAAFVAALTNYTTHSGWHIGNIGALASFVWLLVAFLLNIYNIFRNDYKTENFGSKKS